MPGSSGQTHQHTNRQPDRPTDITTEIDYALKINISILAVNDIDRSFITFDLNKEHIDAIGIQEK